jgi:alpha-L-fucosidase 2
VTAVGRTVPASSLALDLPEDLTATPVSRQLRPLRDGESASLAFEVTPQAGQRPEHRVTALLTGDGGGRAALPGSAGRPGAGGMGPAVRRHRRGRLGPGTGRRCAGHGGLRGRGPTGSALVLDGQTYLRTTPTTLGFLKVATFAAEIRVDGSGSYRRLFDWQPSGNDGSDGVLIDLTPSNAVRFIGSGTGVRGARRHDERRGEADGVPGRGAGRDGAAARHRRHPDGGCSRPSPQKTRWWSSANSS